MKKLRDILRQGIEKNASDIHISASNPVAYRIKKKIVFAEDGEILDSQTTKDLVSEILNQNGRGGEIDSLTSLDCAYHYDDNHRFRVNIFKQINGYSISARLIINDYKNKINSKMPDILNKILEQKSGLFLVVGPTGSGKSTTATYLIDNFNKMKKYRIICIEDPVEYIHTRNNSIIEHRSLGEDVGSFAEGLKSALRQDPDVIFVGEMRDEETIEVALKAAETGHLVISTLHTDSAKNTLTRIIDAFPAEKHHQIKQQLASVLIGVIAQELVYSTTLDKLILATEVLTNTKAVANSIRTDKIHQLETTLQTGSSEGMYSFQQNIQKLYTDGFIDKETMDNFLNSRGEK